MMDTCRRALGDDAVYGAKFPQEETVNQRLKQKEWENNYEYRYRLYLFNKYEKEQHQEKLNKAKDANSNGFYECAFTLQGMKWHAGLDDVLSRYRVIKIVAQALPNTNPHFVDRVLFMVRNPREIARSFERIGNGEHLCEDEYKRQAMTMPMPLNYILGMAQACQWILQNDVSVLPICYSELIKEPDKVLDEVGSFVGKDFSNHGIEPSQYRAKEDEESLDELWTIAIKIYFELRAGNWENVLELRKEASPYIRKERSAVTCARSGMNVSYHQCVNCYNGQQDMITNYKANAEQQKIDWPNEPCAFECGFANPNDLADGQFKTIEQSIENNHWRQ